MGAVKIHALTEEAAEDTANEGKILCKKGLIRGVKIKIPATAA